MKLPTFSEFAAQARAQGFDEVLERPWPPDTVLPTHIHPFDASALVVQGTMWLTEGGHTRKLGPGDRFEIARDVPHDERYDHAAEFLLEASDRRVAAFGR